MKSVLELCKKQSVYSMAVDIPEHSLDSLEHFFKKFRFIRVGFAEQTEQKNSPVLVMFKRL
jgi:hypothetical protein